MSRDKKYIAKTLDQWIKKKTPQTPDAVAPSSCAVSPSNCVVTPSNCAVSPSSCVVTPSNCAVSPSNCAVSPSNCAVSPSNCAVSPSSCAVTPTIHLLSQCSLKESRRMTPFATSNLNTPPFSSPQVAQKRKLENDVKLPNAEKKRDPCWLRDIRDDQLRVPSDPEYDATTLFIPQEAWECFTNFEKQYWTYKSKYFDTVLFFKKGRFYELYERDADICARDFGMVVSHGNRGFMRMSGVPDYAFDEWAQKFLARGYKISRVDQEETVAAKNYRQKNSGKRQRVEEEKIIQRKLTAVYSAGTLIDPTGDAATNTLCLWSSTNAFDAVIVETSTAQLYVCRFSDSDMRHNLETLCMRIAPRELVLDRTNISKTDLKLLGSFCPGAEVTFLAFQTNYSANVANLQNYWPEFPLVGLPDELCQSSTTCIAAMVAYLQRMCLDAMFKNNKPLLYSLDSQKTMILDGATLLNLNIVSDGPCLYSILNHCVSGMGKRMLKKWICHPFCHKTPIIERQEAILEIQNLMEFSNLHEKIRQLPDLERVIGRIFLNSPKKSQDVFFCVELFKQVHDTISSLNFSCNLLSQLLNERYPDISNVIFDFESQFNLKEKRPYSSSNFDEAMLILNNVQESLDNFLLNLKEKYGDVVYVDNGKELNLVDVPLSLKIKKNNWKLVGNTKTRNRYSVPEVETLNEQMSDAKEALSVLLKEAEVIAMNLFCSHAAEWRSVVSVVAELDVLISLAKACNANKFTCIPNFVSSKSSFIEAKGLRHACFPPEGYICNDTCLGLNHPSTIVLTGPNMGGKSTFLRQTGVAVILAQMGCLIPAESCSISIFDAVYTRIGARDNLVEGKSTFFVELHETAHILNNATCRSLVLMDELGRGTSTFDGQSIALGVLHYLCFRISACTLFATHYVGLVKETNRWPKLLIQHAHMDCIVGDGSVVFLYKLKPGVAPKSHGMNVALMAGLPKSVIKLANELSDQFEADQEDINPKSVGSCDLANFSLVWNSDFAVNAIKAVCRK